MKLLTNRRKLLRAKYETAAVSSSRWRLLRRKRDIQTQPNQKQSPIPLPPPFGKVFLHFPSGESRSSAVDEVVRPLSAHRIAGLTPRAAMAVHIIDSGALDRQVTSLSEDRCPLLVVNMIDYHPWVSSHLGKFSVTVQLTGKVGGRSQKWLMLITLTSLQRVSRANWCLTSAASFRSGQ